jgi:CheY-like chemotaxis protein
MEEVGDLIVKRLLLIDDEEPVLCGMRRYFEALGYDVACARNRSETEALLDHEVDCAVVDLCLTPGQGPDGLALVATLRAHQPAVRIVVLTALATPEAESAALALGADAFLSKPQRMQRLVDIIAGGTSSEAR